MAPISVRSVPRETWTSSPCERILASTAAISGFAGVGLHHDDHGALLAVDQKQIGRPFGAARSDSILALLLLRSRAALGDSSAK